MPGLVSPRQFGTDAYSIGRVPYQTNNLSLNLRTPDSGSEEPSEPPTRAPASNPASQPKSTGSFWSNALSTAEKIGAGAAGVGAAALGLSHNGSTAGSALKAGLDEIPGFERVMTAVPKEFGNLGRQFEGIGSDIAGAAKGANSFLESTSSGGGLVNAAKGTGEFAPGSTETPFSGMDNFKAPDSIENIGSDLGDLAGIGRDAFGLAA